MEKLILKQENDAEVHVAGKSDAYKQAFKATYAAVWSLEEQKKTHFEKGKEQGLAQETMDDSQVVQSLSKLCRRIQSRE